VHGLCSTPQNIHFIPVAIAQYQIVCIFLCSFLFLSFFFFVVAVVVVLLCVCLSFFVSIIVVGRGNRWVGGWVCQFVDGIQMLDRMVIQENFYSLQCYSSKHRTVSSKSSGGITLQEYTTCLDIFSD